MTSCWWGGRAIIGAKGNYLVYVVNVGNGEYGFRSGGSIAPTTFVDSVGNTGTITECYQNIKFNEFHFKIDMFLADYQNIKLSRVGSDKYYTPINGSEESGTAIFDCSLFTMQDEGSLIPIWIGYELPPWIN